MERNSTTWCGECGKPCDYTGQATDNSTATDRGYQGGLEVIAVSTCHGAEVFTDEDLSNEYVPVAGEFDGGGF